MGRRIARVPHRQIILGVRKEGQGGESRSYATVLQQDYGATEIWPCVNTTIGTTLPAFIDTDRNGTIVANKKNAAGPVSGTLAPLCNGVNQYSDVLTGINAIFDYDTGAVFFWLKAANASVWLDTSEKDYILHLYDSNANSIAFTREAVQNIIKAQYRSGGGNNYRDIGVSTTDWFSLGLSWDQNADEVRAFLNGAQVGDTLTGLNAWSDDGDLIVATFAAQNTTPLKPWPGWFAYLAVKFGSVWSPADFAAMHAAAATAQPD